ncbi:ubiquinone anaerobic biosynthesis accessory factor UbiT [Rhodovibrio sodomensis]|uniref:ubiquinone anaerobic biosynthesis accessory factor UbiT n=1 Tax=Rhodovibrio sodomensis TaxID=1088 RepID=UPI001907EC4A
MSAGVKRLTPLTPIAVLLRPLPTAPLQAALQRLADRLSARHPDVLDRVADIGRARLLLLATDLPWRALVTLERDGARVTVDRHADGPDPQADAAVTGPVERLLACVQGGGDGDAMFFAREIAVTGNTDVLVALRNALDGAELDIAGELAALTGPLQGPATQALGRAGAVYGRASAGLDAFKADVRAPLQARLDAQAAELAELRTEVQRLRRKQPRGERTAAQGAQGRQEAAP